MADRAPVAQPSSIQYRRALGTGRPHCAVGDASLGSQDTKIDSPLPTPGMASAGRNVLLRVVQAPGWGIGSDYLRTGLEPLSQHFTLLYYDTRGSGRSSRPADAATMTVSEMADDLEGLRQYFGLESMTLLGHSWGGGIALAYAMRYPTRLNKLVLVDSAIPGFNFSEISQELHKQWGDAKSDPRLANAMASMEADMPVNTDEEFQAKLQRESPWWFYDPTSAVPRYEKTLPGVPSVWAWNAWGANFGPGKSNMATDGKLVAIKAHTLIIEGAQDRVCPLGIANHIHAGIQRSSLIVLEKAGHLPWIEAPGMFFPAVIQFAQN
jgi:proline iminopeptidase